MSANPFYQSPEWKRTRAKAIALNKRAHHGVLVCQVCKGVVMQRPNVDHIKRVRDYPQLAHEQSNLQVLHASCHSRFKQLDEANAHKPEIGLDGFPVGGGW